MQSMHRVPLSMTRPWTSAALLADGRKVRLQFRQSFMSREDSPVDLGLELEYALGILVHDLLDHVILEAKVPVVFDRLPHGAEGIRTAE